MALSRRQFLAGASVLAATWGLSRDVVGRALAFPLRAEDSPTTLLQTIKMAARPVRGAYRTLVAITPYLLLAVVDGQPRPLAVNFAALRDRWGRWLLTVAVIAVVCLVIWLLSALDGFFVTGFLGAIIGWLGIGLVSGWLICAWVLVYRSVLDAHRGP